MNDVDVSEPHDARPPVPRIEFEDCCLRGNFVATYIGLAPDRAYGNEHTFDIGRIDGGFRAYEVTDEEPAA